MSTTHTDTRIALVTGANRGLGRSTAIALAAAGFRVVVTYRSDAEAAAETAGRIADTGGDAITMPLDVADVGSFGRFMGELSGAVADRWGTSRLDVMVNNAGIGLFGPLESVTPDQFDQTSPPTSAARSS